MNCLNKLHWFSIDGCPTDGYLLKEILLAAPNLYIIIINMSFLLQLIDKENDQVCISLLRNRIKHLSIQISDENELNDKNIEKLSNIFDHVRHIIVENRPPNIISFCNNILLLLHYFKKNQLISIICRGFTTIEMRSNPSQWLLNHTYLKDFTDKFIAECDELEFKIWL